MADDKVTLKQFHEACRLIVLDQERLALNYCVGYAKAGLGLSGREAVHRQAIYIKDNMKNWRGPTAAAVRATLTQVIEDWRY